MEDMSKYIMTATLWKKSTQCMKNTLIASNRIQGIVKNPPCNVANKK